MNNMIEFPKFCDENEILVADELWSYLSGEEGMMQKLLSQIRDIATAAFMDEYMFINTPSNLIDNTDEYIEIASRWGLCDEVAIANSINGLVARQDKKINRNLYLSVFDAKGNYNENRVRNLLPFC